MTTEGEKSPGAGTCKDGGTVLADISYEIIRTIGVLSENFRGWTIELNLILWNGGKPKYDIRDWAPEHEKMGRVLR